MAKPLFATAEEFEKVLKAIDRELAASGIDIPGRPLRAIMEFGTRYKISIPLAGGAARLPPDLAENLQLSIDIDEWYKKTYGDRLKMDFSPGQIVALIEDDIWLIRLPKIFGQVQFVLGRQFLPRDEKGALGAVCNVVQLVSGMTEARASELPDAVLTGIGDTFALGMQAVHIMEANPQPLLQAARGDARTTVACLTESKPRFGEAKWAALQMAEKSLKAALDLAGVPYPKTHKLEVLRSLLEGAGVSAPIQSLLEAIQCDAGIRYGEQTCTRAEAIRAHHASYQLPVALRQMGVGFLSNLA